MFPSAPKFGLILTCLVLFGLLIRGELGVAGDQLPGDFLVYLKALDRVKSGMSPYVLSEGSPYKYAPGFLIPFHLLPSDPKIAWWIFKSFGILALGVSWWMGWRNLTIRSPIPVVIGFSLAWKGIIEALDYGQVEFLALGLASFGFALYPARPLWSGFVFGLLPVIKLPWALAAFPLLLIRAPIKDFFLSIAGAFAGFVIPGLVLPVLVYGKDRSFLLFHEWFTLIRGQEVSGADMLQSIWSAAVRAKSIGGVAGIAFGTSIVLILLAWARTFRRPIRLESPNPFLLATSGLLFMQLMNPHAWRWGSVFLLGIGLCYPFPRNIQKSDLVGTVGLIALFLLQLNPVVRLIGFRHWTDLHPYSVVTLYWALGFWVVQGRVRSRTEIGELRS